jgi:hypothetical protein
MTINALVFLFLWTFNRSSQSYFTDKDEWSNRGSQQIAFQHLFSCFNKWCLAKLYGAWSSLGMAWPGSVGFVVGETSVSI